MTNLIYFEFHKRVKMQEKKIKKIRSITLILPNKIVEIIRK